MPTYSLKCPQCQHKWTDFMWMSERENALCRLMMAYSTKKSETFDYSNYVKKSS